MYCTGRDLMVIITSSSFKRLNGVIGETVKFAFPVFVAEKSPFLNCSEDKIQLYPELFY